MNHCQIHGMFTPLLDGSCLQCVFDERGRSLDAGRRALLCGKYLGDNDGTCPQLACVRTHGHTGLCDNVNGDDDAAE